MTLSTIATTHTVAPAASPDLTVWERLSGPLTARGVPTYRRWAPHPVEGSGTAYVVLLPATEPWATPGYHSAKHLSVFVNIYSDRTRDPVELQDAPDRALGIWELVDPLLHGVTNEEWSAVISCSRSTDPAIHDVPSGDGAVLVSSKYDLCLW